MFPLIESEFHPPRRMGYSGLTVLCMKRALL